MNKYGIQLKVEAVLHFDIDADDSMQATAKAVEKAREKYPSADIRVIFYSKVTLPCDQQ